MALHAASITQMSARILPRTKRGEIWEGSVMPGDVTHFSDKRLFFFSDRRACAARRGRAKRFAGEELGFPSLNCAGPIPAGGRVSQTPFFRQPR